MSTRPFALPASTESMVGAWFRLLPDRGPRTTWQVKASTLCNLRCRYCYEWDRLADRRRMTLDEWRLVLEAVRRHRRLREIETGDKVPTTVVWHGGEPLLHPPGYVRDVLALQREVLGNGAPSPSPVRNGVQTNLTRTGETLDVMVEAGFIFSVSADFAGGARLDRAGRDSGARVMANLRELLRRRASFGVAVVLARHNHDRLDAIHDQVGRLGARWLRINPMLPPPPAAPAGGLHLSVTEVNASLEGLFCHWIKSGARLPVQPLSRALRTAVRRRMGIASPVPARGHVRFVVHPDGSLTGQGGTAGSTNRLGNVFRQTLDEILEGRAFHRARRNEEALRSRHCRRCDHVGACDGRAVLDHPGALPPGPCPTESRLCGLADRLLDVVGVQSTTSRHLPKGPEGISNPSQRRTS